MVGRTNALVWWAAELVLWAVTLVGWAAPLVWWTTALLRWAAAELERTWENLTLRRETAGATSQGV